MGEIKLGKYQHFKGNFYEVIGLARHSQALEELVVYRALYVHPQYKENPLWVRPKAMFLENVMHEGEDVPRFKFVG